MTTKFTFDEKELLHEALSDLTFKLVDELENSERRLHQVQASCGTLDPKWVNDLKHQLETMRSLREKLLYNS